MRALDVGCTWEEEVQEVCRACRRPRVPTALCPTGGDPARLGATFPSAVLHEAPLAHTGLIFFPPFFLKKKS